MRFLLLAVFFSVPNFCFSDSGEVSIEAIIDAQVAAYNAHDIKKYASFFHDDIVQMNYPDEIDTKGKDALIDQFLNLFNRNKPHAVILNRMVVGNTVIDHEKMKYTENGKQLEAEGVVIYTVKGQLIHRMEVIQ